MGALDMRVGGTGGVSQLLRIARQPRNPHYAGPVGEWMTSHVPRHPADALAVLDLRDPAVARRTFSAPGFCCTSQIVHIGRAAAALPRQGLWLQGGRYGVL